MDDSFRTLTQLNLKQDALFREGLRCAELGLYRSAHVAAFAAFIDFVHEWIGASPERFEAMRSAYPGWKLVSPSDFRNQTDYGLIEALRAEGLITKSMQKAMHGLLAKRNECAHPEPYEPGLNDTLGYLDELMKRIRTLSAL